MKIGVISLGCDKNRIDTENMLAYLQEKGHVFTQDPGQAELIVVNTCAFIDSAKEEAIDTIFEMAQYKKSGVCKRLVVTGCLPQRYMEDLAREMEDVDLFLGTGSYARLPELIDEMIADQSAEPICVPNGKDERNFTQKRVLTTPYHYAYLKIAEGCDNRCTYCAIPSIRGKYTSRPIADVVAEAEELVREYGVQELIVVAQDVTRYGEDLYGENKLIELLDRLGQLPVHWIRLLYLYPERVTDALLDYMVQTPKICKYLDIPCQHISDTILKKMGRKVSKDRIVALLDKIDAYGVFTVRSTFIVGFPQESESDFRELEDLIASGRFDRCGFFTYSQEEGTPAARMSGQIDEETKKERQERLYAIQQSVMAQKLDARVGSVAEVLYDEIDYDRQMFAGRSAQDAPEIDTVVYFTAKSPVEIGRFYRVKITGTDGFDCIGEVTE